jgi:hypothetical protein
MQAPCTQWPSGRLLVTNGREVSDWGTILHNAFSQRNAPPARLRTAAQPGCPPRSTSGAMSIIDGGCRSTGTVSQIILAFNAGLEADHRPANYRRRPSPKQRARGSHWRLRWKPTHARRFRLDRGWQRTGPWHYSLTGPSGHASSGKRLLRDNLCSLSRHTLPPVP